MTQSDSEPNSPAIPGHVAIVMDGNGRWARERALRREEGHQHGRIKLHDVVRAFSERGVRYLTLYAFSTENWRRPNEEVKGLMALAAEAIKEDAPASMKRALGLSTWAARIASAPTSPPQSTASWT